MKDKARRTLKPAPGLTQISGGPGPTVTCDGKVWRFGYNTQNAKAHLEELIRAHVLAESRANDTADEYQETRDRVRGGHYRTFSKGWLNILDSPDGTILYPLSLLKEHHPEATTKDVRRMMAKEPDQFVDALEEVSPDFWRVVAVEWASDEKEIDPDKAAELGAKFAEKFVEGFQTVRTERTPGPGIG